MKGCRQNGNIKALDGATEDEKAQNLTAWARAFTAKDLGREDGLVDWANAFSAKDWDAVKKFENSGVKEAQQTMEAIMSSPEQRQMIWNRRKALLDYKSEMEDAETGGMLNVLSGLVQNQLITVSEAAKRAGMTESEFIARTEL